MNFIQMCGTLNIKDNKVELGNQGVYHGTLKKFGESIGTTPY